MRECLIFAAMLFLFVAALLAQESTAVRRLGGSKISSTEINRAVPRLMKAAEVTGTVAIRNDGKVASVKAYGVRDKEKGSRSPGSVLVAELARLARHTESHYAW
jgi:hypothetical protein